MDARIRARRRAVLAAGYRRRRRITLSVLSAVALLGLAFAVSHSPLFAVDEVRVTGLEGERAALVDRLAAVSPGERLLSVDLDAIRDDVIGLPFVREVAVTRVPPSTIQIAVVPRVPVVAVAVPGASWLLDADGVVDAERSVLPGPGVEVSDAAVRNAVEVHVGLPGPLRAQIDRYDAPSERGLRLHLAEDDIWVRFGVAERVPAKAQVIGLLLDQAREQAARAGRSDLGVAELDVRAPDNPVLVPRTDG
jgi:cell division protein FtsQ